MKTKIWLFTLLAAFLTIVSSSHTSPQHQFKGYVLDDAGEALIGATVLIKGTKLGAVTDFNGFFQLSHGGAEATLLVSYIGFATQEVLAKAGQEVRIQLTSSVQLDEVVVVNKKKLFKKNKTSAITAAKSNKRAKKRKSKRKPRVHSTQLQMESVAPAGVRMYSPAVVQGAAVPPASQESYDVIQENRFYTTKEDPLSTFSIDVDAASYSNTRRFLNNGELPPKDAVRIEEMINYFNYDYPQPEGPHPFGLHTEMGPCPWNPDHQLFHIGMQAKRVETKDLPASNLVFLLDVSGSMNAPNKLPLLKTSLRLLTDQLRPEDQVAIVVYAGAAGLVLPSTSGSAKQTIKEALDKLSAGGSTAGGAGIQLAYQVARKHFIQNGNNRIILATDGDFNVGASSDSDMIWLIEKERESGIFLSVLGFGMGNYKDSKMQKLADHGNGNHAYIDQVSEAKKVLISEFGGTLFTVAKDVKLQLEFNPAKVAGYRLIGYENRLLDHQDFADDRKDAGEMGAGHTVTALYEIIPVGAESPFLPKETTLKYQNKAAVGTASDDVLMVKLRYKEADGHKSRLLEQEVVGQPSVVASENFLWSSSVASFGMLLRQSKYKGELSYLEAIGWAEKAKGKDANGYRAEMIDLMRKAQSLVDPNLAGK
ncbi:MAG: von Willebrand factor type A domain-containing protein [Bacteroidota bacterium]